MERLIFFLRCMVSLCSGSGLYAQEDNSDAGIPSIQQMPADENYEFLNENDSAKFFLKPLKWIRFGRQEVNLRASRFIGLREGPNIRQSFDLIRLDTAFEHFQILAFCGTYVNPNFDVSIFGSDTPKKKTENSTNIMYACPG